MRLLSFPGLTLFSQIIAQTGIRRGFFNQARLNGHTGKYFQFLNPGQGLLRGEWFSQFACKREVLKPGPGSFSIYI